MWVAFVFMGYLLLALLIPAAWALVPVWSSARRLQLVRCPALDRNAIVQLNPASALRVRIAGEGRPAVRNCLLWPERANCPANCTK